jgi:cytoskeletal protein CcmA (bactofilin family)
LDSGPPPLPARRPADSVERSLTIVGPGTVFRGDLVSSDPVEIRGTLEGDLRVAALCTVSEGGRVLGNIDAIALVVAGQVTAGMLTADRIEIRASGQVVGLLRARRVIIADGAHYEGDIETAAAAPTRTKGSGLELTHPGAGDARLKT